MKAEVNLERCRVLKTRGCLGLLRILAAVGLVQSEAACAQRNIPAFDAKTMNEALDVVGVVSLESSAVIHLTVPEIAENGAFVLFTVNSSVPHTEQISILVDENPSMHSANFILPVVTEGVITPRIKMLLTAIHRAVEGWGEVLSRLLRNENCSGRLRLSDRMPGFRSTI